MLKLKSVVFASITLHLVGGGSEVLAQSPDQTILFSDERLDIRWHLQAGVNGVAEKNLFWNLSDIFAMSADYDPDKGWIEYYLKPGISFQYKPTDQFTLYGKASAVASYTQNLDAYDQGNSGRVTLEEAYLGFRAQYSGSSGIDVSVGPRELKLGTGMLIANGGSSGFERGALKFGPRKAWEKAAILRGWSGNFEATAFFIDPNEVPSSDSRNQLAGVDLRYNGDASGFLGTTYIKVLQSESAYPKAAPNGNGPPTILSGAREGLEALNLYGRSDRLESPFGESFVGAEASFERNQTIDMQAWAGRFQAGHEWTDFIWSPSLTYTFKTFSGDDPSSTALERFDPLYYDGNPSTWATGSKSSMTFINSNVKSHEVALKVKPTQRDTITLRYAHIRANELRSPIQFGQATRFELAGGDNVVSGVTDPHLADDIFLEYSRILNQNTFLTAGISASRPGRGLNLAAGTTLPVWYGGFVNLVVNY